MSPDHESSAASAVIYAIDFVAVVAASVVVVTVVAAVVTVVAVLAVVVVVVFTQSYSLADDYCYRTFKISAL